MDLPKDNIGKLVLSYKTLKGVPYDNVVWNKTQWGRTAKRAKELLEICENDLRTADACLVDLAGRFDEASLPWTFETIIKHAFDWITQKKGPQDAKTRARKGLFDAIAQQRAKELGSGNRGNDAPRSLPDRSRDLSEVPGTSKENDLERGNGQHGVCVARLLEEPRRVPLDGKEGLVGRLGTSELPGTAAEPK